MTPINVIAYDYLCYYFFKFLLKGLITLFETGSE